MHKCIDWRCRPPFGSYLGGALYPQGCNPFTMDEAIAEMDKAECVIGMAGFRTGMDLEDLIKLDEQYGERFKSLMHVDPWDGETAIPDIQKYVVDGPAAGVIIEPGQKFIKKPVRADDEMLYPIYEFLQKNDILTTITFGGLFNYDPGLYNPSYIAHVCNDFPKLKIVISHGGWPNQMGLFHVAYSHEFLYISPDAYMQEFHPGHRDYADAANNWLQDKILFGSAAAFYTGTEGMIQRCKNSYLAQLNENVIDKVLYHNAAGLLGLEPLTKYYAY